MRAWRFRRRRRAIGGCECNRPPRRRLGRRRRGRLHGPLLRFRERRRRRFHQHRGWKDRGAWLDLRERRQRLRGGINWWRRRWPHRNLVQRGGQQLRPRGAKLGHRWPRQRIRPERKDSLGRCGDHLPRAARSSDRRGQRPRCPCSPQQRWDAGGDHAAACPRRRDRHRCRAAGQDADPRRPGGGRYPGGRPAGGRTRRRQRVRRLSRHVGRDDRWWWQCRKSPGSSDRRSERGRSRLGALVPQRRRADHRSRAYSLRGRARNRSSAHPRGGRSGGRRSR